MSNDSFGRFPSIKELLESPQLKYVAEQFSNNTVVQGIRSFFDHLRGQVQATADELEVPGPDDLANQIAKWILAEDQVRLRPVINATGILLPANLGRSPLAREALDEIRAVGESYSNLEIDLTTGEAIPRSAAVVPLLTQLTGAEGAIIVNSHAAATLLAIAALATGKEVIVSRGEMIEIGNDYRLPQILQLSGASVREAGSTNATRLSDYAAALGDRSAAILRADPSSAAAAAGERPSLADLAALAKQRVILLIDDIGLGSAIDLAPLGLTGIPSAAASIAAGATLVVLRGDGLLGGPQCGIILGGKAWIERIAEHPLAGLFLSDKLTLAALAATLRPLSDPAEAKRLNPLLGLITTSVENLRNRAERLAPQIAASPGIASAEAVASESCLTVRSIPGQRLASYAIAVTPCGGSPEELVGRLQTGKTAIVARVEGASVLLDLRTVFPRQDIELVTAIDQLT